VDPRGDPGALLKVVRGASFVDGGDRLTATARMAMAPVTALATLGFRCAMDPPGAPGGSAPGASAQ
jgi:serine/threonine-protein kinase